jgi:acyl-CoA synthetase (AMP-forming)/AMP-acid ligase II
LSGLGTFDELESVLTVDSGVSWHKLVTSFGGIASHTISTSYGVTSSAFVIMDGEAFIAGHALLTITRADGAVLFGTGCARSLRNPLVFWAENILSSWVGGSVQIW